MMIREELLNGRNVEEIGKVNSRHVVRDVITARLFKVKSNEVIKKLKKIHMCSHRVIIHLQCVGLHIIFAKRSCIQI